MDEEMTWEEFVYQTNAYYEESHEEELRKEEESKKQGRRTMDNVDVEVNGRTLTEGIYLENAIKICEKCFTNINAFRQTFRNLSWFCGLREDELNRLT